jgi:signal transduction histidine kinase
MIAMLSESNTQLDERPPRIPGGQHPIVRRNLQLAFEGGPMGQRRAALLFFITVAPVAVVISAALSSEHRFPVTLGRGAALLAIVCWLLVRTTPRFWEWVLILAVLAAGSVVAQLSVGAAHSGVFALNSIGVMALVCLVFETRLVVIGAMLSTAGYAVAQQHFFSTGDAAAATLMFAIVVALMAVLIHGTALYLRESLHRTGELHAQMDETAERERARIAGELHDDTIQVLIAAGMRLDLIHRRSEIDRATTYEAPIREVRELIRQAVDRTRRLTFELYPPQLDRQGLGSALEALGRQVEQEATFTVDISVGSNRAPHGVEQLAYRTIKELLANAAKHSQATHVTVDVTTGSDTLSGVVADDGRGFDAAAVSEARRDFHIGLDAAADRIRSAGGSLEITSRPGEGTRASFTLPIDRAGS